MTIWFDMDGTIANLYAVENWLDFLLNSDPMPYKCAKPIGNFSVLARFLNKAQKNGIKIGIISWTSKNSTKKYENDVISAKIEWLKAHLPSVNWDFVYIVPYGTKKSIFKTENDILFDDELQNRDDWGKNGLEPTEIFRVLKEVA